MDVVEDVKLDAEGAGAAKVMLSHRQREQLRLLFDLKAKTRATAKAVRDAGGDKLSSNVIGRLAVLGLADARTIRPRGGSQYTAYFLTPKGLEVARKIRMNRNGS